MSIKADSIDNGAYNLQQPVVLPVAVWRRAAKSGTNTPLVVFLHGRGADEYDLLALADRLPRAFNYVGLRGLVAVEGAGYTWFENRGVGRPIAKSIRGSIVTLRAWLDDAAARESRTRVYVMGFSAGMMMAGALVLDDPARFAGAILLSGALPLDSGIAANSDRLAGLPVFYGRGVHDDVMPASLVAQADAYLRGRSGADLTVREYGHAHAISNREVDDIAAWMDEHV